ncbi:MAG: hypothetical protein GX094_07240 [Clostridiales bacterium]|jgi:energy-coupling factor transporter ATP-binding protein EcfA2|nr:hypothetical protein [Clostridiales bacterium]
MIHFIVGPRGSGKTRRVIEMANRATQETKGNIVFIDGDHLRTRELKYQVRFVNINEFEIEDLDMLYGFLCGIIAGDYDVEQIYIDGILEALAGDVNKVESFVGNIRKLSDRFNVNFIVTLSGSPESLPVFLKEYVLDECIA